MSPDILSLVRPLLENANTLNLPTAEQTAHLTRTEIAWIRRVWYEARAIAAHFTYNATWDAAGIPVALAMLEWVGPYIRQVVAQYFDSHLLKRLVLQQVMIEDIRIAIKPIPQ